MDIQVQLMFQVFQVNMSIGMRLMKVPLCLLVMFMLFVMEAQMILFKMNVMIPILI